MYKKNGAILSPKRGFSFVLPTGTIGMKRYSDDMKDVHPVSKETATKKLSTVAIVFEDPCTSWKTTMHFSLYILYENARAEVRSSVCLLNLLD